LAKDSKKGSVPFVPSGDAIPPTAYSMLCVRLPHIFVRDYSLRSEINTRYGRVANSSPVPKLCLGTPFLEAPASHCIPREPSLGSWSFRDCVPNEDVGNERNHKMRPLVVLSAISTQEVSFRLRHAFGGSPLYPAESGSSSYGLPVRFRLLSTPPRGDAVTFSFGVMAYSGQGLSPC